MNKPRGNLNSLREKLHRCDVRISKITRKYQRLEALATANLYSTARRLNRQIAAHENYERFLERQRELRPWRSRLPKTNAEFALWLRAKTPVAKKLFDAWSVSEIKKQNPGFGDVKILSASDGFNCRFYLATKHNKVVGHLDLTLPEHRAGTTTVGSVSVNGVNVLDKGIPQYNPTAPLKTWIELLKQKLA